MMYKLCLTHKKGVTLISLVVTILILTILATIGISAGTSTLKNVRINEFNVALKTIQTRVNSILEEEPTAETLNLLGQSISGLAANKQSAITTALAGQSSDGFRYFNKQDLETIGVKEIDREVIINFTTKEVVDINGVENTDGTRLYRLDTPSNNINYVEENTTAPSFNLTKENYGLTAKIMINNIVYDESVSKGGEVLYSKQGSSEWKNVIGKEIIVTEGGIYTVRVKDLKDNYTDQNIEIAIVNPPKLDTGMTPVIYDQTLKKWKKVEPNSGIWFDYASDTRQWANVMLQDGLTINNDGTIDNDKMGSMFVWIPRFAYKIDEGYHTSNAGIIDIKFLSERSGVCTDGENVTFANASGKGNWNIHPVFQDGTKTNFANGEWNKEIEGFWFGKFEASSDQTVFNTETNEFNTQGAQMGRTSNTTNYVRVIPNTLSWRGITIAQAYNICKNISNQSNHGLSTNSNAHLMKNSEWGAVAYITQSVYGNPQNSADASSGLWSNNSHIVDNVDTEVNEAQSNYGLKRYLGTLTGFAGTKRNDSTSGYCYLINADYSQEDRVTITYQVRKADGTNNGGETTKIYYRYNTVNGEKSTTTRTIYGIYDMSGGSWEFVAAYLNNGNTNARLTTFKSISEHEKQIYIGDGAATTEGRIENLEANSALYGDAVYETCSDDAVTGRKAWNTDYTYYIDTTNMFLRRGGSTSTTDYSGTNAFYYATGASSANIGFRPALVVE